MEQSINQRLVTHQFSAAVLLGVVDDAIYEDFRDCLLKLAVQWKGKKQISKAIAFVLSESISIVRNKITEYRSNGLDDDADRLEDMFIELDRIVMEECLQD